MNARVKPDKESRLAVLRSALDQGTMRAVHRMVNAMHPAEVARLLESLPPATREIVWDFVDPDSEGDILVELNEQARAPLISGMDAEELVAVAETLEVDDLADLMADLPEAVTRQVLRSMDQQDRDRLNLVRSFPEDSAGGLMNTDTVSVRPDVPLEVVLRYVRMRGELPDKTDSLFVVSRHDEFLGTLSVTRLLTEDPERTVAEVLDSAAARIDPATPANDVAKLFQDRDLVSAAVVAQDGRLLGRITVDDVVDVIREEAAHSVLSMAGLDEEDDLFAGVARSARRRAVWLAINLLTAVLAAYVVGLYQATIEKVVALAALMPIVASMGGIAGTQTVTIMIRGLALGQVQSANARWLLLREIAVGAINGLALAALVALGTALVFRTWTVAAIIFAALIINLLAAAIVGVLVPLALKRLRIDPALAGGVVLTTFTDCIGFAALLGLGTTFLT
jgi:magnesium transporter